MEGAEPSTVGLWLEVIEEERILYMSCHKEKLYIQKKIMSVYINNSKVIHTS